MASISKEIVIESSAEDVWEVIGDFAAGPSRMAPGFVLDTQAEGDCRIVTFVNGTVVRERRVSVDHDTRRIVYAVVGGDVQPEHDNASMQVVADGERRCRLVWIRDVLPDELSASMADAMSHGLEVIKRTLDDTHDPRHGSRA
ncbi:SRPBCC family protein [Labedaea rhizosphaerae]|uniref:Polyketide cyclase/dehydrase/lipid transport protein n=1 Tax=Labedaea rhizosphaerae TaxID=598644 RepID=A0A4R6SDX1_LABRH|nr:SRPBCC family protein [Labedaea rhizosphaerae]TDP97887.1 polyketide cyclase/dehydrase/lipid transport protein [Labedaea rhizosphaerae]